jgi:DnaJ-class molecular chaperone
MTPEQAQQREPQPPAAPVEDDGLGTGDERLEIIEYRPTVCPDCDGQGWRYGGGPARERDRCDLCRGGGILIVAPVRTP